MIVEAVASVATGSLALLSDAGHMATDAVGLGMALAAIVVADRTVTNGHTTYGLYRLEILAALANAILLFAVAGYVVYEAIRRLNEPPEVLAGPMLVVAVGGLVVNIVAWRLLRVGARESLNVKGAYYEVLADLIGSIGVIAAALILITTGWPYADALIGAVIGIFILPRAWGLGRQAVRVLIQAAPSGLDLEGMEADLSAIKGTTDIHDLHVWTLTSDMDVATAHLLVADGTDTHRILDDARNVLRDSHGIAHATLQIETDDHRHCAEANW
jgi:cobalt-zinc-cadmium efflux system protein